MIEKTLEQAIADLTTNVRTCTSLSLAELIVNPTPKISREDEDTISHFDDDSLFKLAKAIRKNRTLTYFTIEDLHKSNVSVEWTSAGAEELGKALGNHPRLKLLWLNFSSYKIKPKEIIGFLSAVTFTGSIEELYLSFCTSHKGLLGQVGEVLSQNTTIEYMSIDGDDFKSSRSEGYTDEILSDFASAFSNKLLRSINLKHLALNDFGIDAISNNLKDITTLREITFQMCRISDQGMTAINNLVLNNTRITLLDLSNNPLGMRGIKSLADTLPSLPRLKKLFLHDTRMDVEALNYMVTILRRDKIPLTNLNLSGRYNDLYFILVIKKLIDRNEYLDTLNINNETESIATHIDELFPVLSNPDRCHLHAISFGMHQKWPPSVYEQLKKILDSNRGLLHIGVGGYKYSKPIEDACVRNRKAYHKKLQQLFISQVIELCNGYFSKFNIDCKDNNNIKENLSTIPVDIFLLILSYVGEGVWGKRKEATMECSRLIFNNFRKRRELIDAGQYSPDSINNSSNIGFWWHKSTHEGKKIFCNPEEDKALLDRICSIM